MSTLSKFTPRRRQLVLKTLAETANFGDAARRAGVVVTTLQNWRARHPEFARDCEEALDRGIENLGDEAIRRAMHGTPRAVFYRGKACGAITLKSDGLLMFMLRARRPERYARAWEQSRRLSEDKAPVTVELIHFGTVEEMEARAAHQGVAIRELDRVRWPAAAGTSGEGTPLAERLASSTSLTPEGGQGPPAERWD